MSVLTAASSRSVENGYHYFKCGNVLSLSQINDHIFNGKVTGSYDNIYNVSIDIKKPRNSHCDCMYANGNRICKHMVALYFKAFPDECLDYEDWYNSSFSFYDPEDEQESFLEDNMNEYVGFEATKERVINYYVDKMNEKDIKDNFKRMLLSSNDFEYTKEYRNALEGLTAKNPFIKTLLKLHEYLSGFCFKYYDDWYENDKSLLTSKEKKEIELNYSFFKKDIDSLLLNPRLAVYDNYMWIIKFYNKRMDEKDKQKYVNELFDYLNYLKHYTYKNKTGKCNILKCIEELKPLSVSERAERIYKYAKYIDYARWSIEKCNNKKELFNLYVNKIEKSSHNSKEQVYLLLLFSDEKTSLDFLNETMNAYYYYDFLFCKNEESLLRLKREEKVFEDYYNKLVNRIKNDYHLRLLYRTLNMIDELYEIDKKIATDSYLYDDASILKTKYSKEIVDYFANKLKIELISAKNRDDYHMLSRYVLYMRKYDGGLERATELFNEHIIPIYGNRPALIEEFQKALLEI